MTVMTPEFLVAVVTIIIVLCDCSDDLVLGDCSDARVLRGCGDVV